MLGGRGQLHPGGGHGGEHTGTTPLFNHVAEHAHQGLALLLREALGLQPLHELERVKVVVATTRRRAVEAMARPQQCQQWRRRRRGNLDRHLVGQFENVRFGLGLRLRFGRPHLRRRGCAIEASQQRVDIVLVVGFNSGRGRRRRRLGRGGRRRRPLSGRLRSGRDLGRGNVVHRLRLRRRRGGRRLRGLGRRRLGLVVGNDAPDRGQNLLHGGFCDLCRLRHLRLHIINALA